MKTSSNPKTTPAFSTRENYQPICDNLISAAQEKYIKKTSIIQDDSTLSTAEKCDRMDSAYERYLIELATLVGFYCLVYFTTHR